MSERIESIIATLSVSLMLALFGLLLLVHDNKINTKIKMPKTFFILPMLFISMIPLFQPRQFR